MSEKTKLEKVLGENEMYRAVIRAGGTSTQVQLVLDEITPVICAQLSPEDIVAHMRTVYDETGSIYASLPEHQQVTDELLEFMELPHLRNGDRIIDLGCGPLARDTIFLSYGDKDARLRLMGRMRNGRTTRERFNIPVIGFDVLGVDGSPEVVSLATQRLAIKKDEWRDGESYFFRSRIRSADIHDVSRVIAETFHGAWSCAALFTHTPKPLVLPALISIAAILEPKGVFGVSYSRSNGGAYDNLRYSRTGRVKYFSRPHASVIASSAEQAGFYLLKESHSDLEQDGIIQKDFFTTQFFQKH